MERTRFGIFDFLPSTGELRRDGMPVRLQAQPAKVLGALIARAGQVVTRDTLQREIWSDGTHVDFERGLNFCIAQVRSALGDSAEAPRYIETVPKQGYRFIAPVTGAIDGSGAPVMDVPSPMATGATGHSRRIALAAAAVTLLGLLGWIVANRVTSRRPTIAVIPFYNETGQPALDPLVQSIGDAAVARLASLERTKTLSVIGNAASLRNPFARKDVQQIARDLGAEWVLIGQLKSDGSALRVIAHLIRAADMKHLWAQTFDDPTFPLDAQIQTGEAIAKAVTASLAPTE
jgi:DNA-binding winged helix-turn-helix (wHTH) protein/TolB-like protein